MKWDYLIDTIIACGNLRMNRNLKTLCLSSLLSRTNFMAASRKICTRYNWSCLCITTNEFTHTTTPMPNHTPYVHCKLYTMILCTNYKHYNNSKSGNKSKMFYHERGNTVILNMHTIIELKLICWLHNFQQPHATCRMKMISSIFFSLTFGVRNSLLD